MNEHDMAAEVDAELLRRARDGDVGAFGEIYERHVGAARRFARSLTEEASDAEDLVAEVFANLLSALRRGKGPTTIALPYIIASVRNEHWRVRRRRVREAVHRHDAGDAGSLGAHRDHSVELVEADVIVAALSSLPVNVRELLWRTEVVGEPLQQLAARRGVSPHVVAVTTHRARGALASAYLEQHVDTDGADVDPACREALGSLAKFVRRRLGFRRTRRLERHLASCAHCRRVHDELRSINRRLRHSRLPFDVGFWTGLQAHLTGWVATSAVPLASTGALALAMMAPVVIAPATRPGPSAAPPGSVVTAAHPTSTTTMARTSQHSLPATTPSAASATRSTIVVAQETSATAAPWKTLDGVEPLPSVSEQDLATVPSDGRQADRISAHDAPLVQVPPPPDVNTSTGGHDEQPEPPGAAGPEPPDQAKQSPGQLRGQGAGGGRPEPPGVSTSQPRGQVEQPPGQRTKQSGGVDQSAAADVVTSGPKRQVKPGASGPTKTGRENDGGDADSGTNAKPSAGDGNDSNGKANEETVDGAAPG